MNANIDELNRQIEELARKRNTALREQKIKEDGIKWCPFCGSVNVNGRSVADME